MNFGIILYIIKLFFAILFDNFLLFLLIVDRCTSTKVTFKTINGASKITLFAQYYLKHFKIRCAKRRFTRVRSTT